MLYPTSNEIFPDGRCDVGKWYVFDFNVSELRRLWLKERDLSPRSKRFLRGQGDFQIATLHDHVELIRVLDRARKRETGLYIELKDPDRHCREGLDCAAACSGSSEPVRSEPTGRPRLPPVLRFQ